MWVTGFRVVSGSSTCRYNPRVIVFLIVLLPSIHRNLSHKDLTVAFVCANWQEHEGPDSSRCRLLWLCVVIGCFKWLYGQQLEKCEAVVEKNTMLEEQMHGCSIHFFPVSQVYISTPSLPLPTPTRYKFRCTPMILRISSKQQWWYTGCQRCHQMARPANSAYEDPHTCSGSFCPSTSANFLNKDVASTSTASKALFQGPDHQVHIGQPLAVEKTAIKTLAVNKHLQEETSIRDDGDGGLAKRARN